MWENPLWKDTQNGRKVLQSIILRPVVWQDYMKVITFVLWSHVLRVIRHTVPLCCQISSMSCRSLIAIPWSSPPMVKLWETHFIIGQVLASCWANLWWVANSQGKHNLLVLQCWHQLSRVRITVWGRCRLFLTTQADFLIWHCFSRPDGTGGPASQKLQCCFAPLRLTMQRFATIFNQSDLNLFTPLSRGGSARRASLQGGWRLFSAEEQERSWPFGCSRPERLPQIHEVWQRGREQPKGDAPSSA